MAVALLGSSGTMVAKVASPATNAFTVGTGGTNVCAFATVVFDDAASMTITAVTYNGVAMTSCGAASKDDSSNAYSQVFYLVNPTTGSNTLSITATGTVRDVYMNLTSFTGVDQTTPVRPGTYFNATGTVVTDGSGNYTKILTSAVGDMTFSCVNGQGGGNVNSNKTSNGSSLGGGYSGASDRAVGAATVTHTWSGGGAGTAISFCGFSIQAAGSGIPNKIYQTKQAPKRASFI